MAYKNPLFTTLKDPRFQIPDTRYQNRFMFTGREYDAETELYYYRSRYYSPTLGRFLQRDLYTWTPNDLRIINFHPDYEVAKVLISSFGLEGTSIERVLNLIHKIPSLIIQIGTSNPSLLQPYLYVGNNPINWVDPWGYDRQKDELLPLLIIGGVVLAYEPTQIGKAVITGVLLGYGLYLATRGPESYPGATKGKITSQYGKERPVSIPFGQNNPIPPTPPNKWKKLLEDIAEWLSQVFGI